MKITKLKLRNFKGIRSFETEFNGTNHIFGDNGTGKTTLVDAFHWLFFDKDSHDRAAFNIKTLDANNEPIHNLEHEVEADIEHEGKKFNLKKVYKEKWTKKRGSAETEFTGHETEYFINDIPSKKGDYQSFIDELISENVFKLISNPVYFASMDWKKQREMLFRMAGELSDQVIASSNDQYVALLKEVAEKSTTISGYNAMIASKIRKMKDELILIPARIDEQDREMPQALNWKEIELERANLQVEISNLDGSMQGKAKALQSQMLELDGLRKDVLRLTRDKQVAQENLLKEANKAREEALQHKNEIQKQISEQMNELSVLNVAKTNNVKLIDTKKQQIASLREKWFEINSQVPDFKLETCCPTCKRDWDKNQLENDRAKLEADFNIHKAIRLDQNNEEGAFINNEVKVLEELVGAQTMAIEELSLKVDELIKQRDTYPIPDAQTVLPVETALDVQINEIKAKINARSQPTSEVVDDPDKLRRRELQIKIDELTKQLAIKDTIEKKIQRKKELADQQLSISQEIASLEKIQDTIIAFTKAKITTIEDRVNSMFSFVKFRMFKQQVNGGEEETCEAMVNGVPWSDLNTASKINAGLDIINTLSDHFNATAPIWIDNREAVIKLIPTKAQVINLHVSEGDKELRIA